MKACASEEDDDEKKEKRTRLLLSCSIAIRSLIHVTWNQRRETKEKKKSEEKKTHTRPGVACSVGGWIVGKKDDEK